MREKILEMLLLQNQLNSDTNGVKWRDDITKNGKVINWKRCIYMETAELIDSFPWKHWKSIDAKIDMDNLKIELVDIWHFIMSYLLKFYEPNELANLISNFIEAKSDIKVPKNWNKEDNLKIDAYLDIFEELMALALIKSDDEAYQEALLETFFKACESVDLDFNSLYKLYIGKNVLNKFRQDFGYKEGTYRKIWNGKEDNVYMQEIIEKEDLDFDTLYKRLEEIYKKI